MSVRKIRSTWWVDFRSEGQRRRIKSPDNSRAGAVAYEMVLRQRIARGEPARPTASRDREPLLQEFAPDWLETYARTNNKPSEYRSKRLTMQNHLLPMFGNYRLSEITTQEVEVFKAAKLREGLRPKSINNYLAVLSKCLSIANDWGRVSSLPKVTYFRAVSQRLDFLSPEESDQLIRGAHVPMWTEMAVLGLRTGMRLGELFGLDWQDIDFDRHQLTVERSIVRGQVGTPKNGRTRHIPLSPATETALRSIRKHSGLVFSRHDGTPLSYNDASKALHRLCDRTGVRRISWHVLRHTFASHLAVQGVPLPIIKDLLGHYSIVMTMRYAHLAPSSLSDAVAILDRS